MECPICLNEWNSATCIPKMLPCGHSLCNKCLSALFVPFVLPQKGGSVQCPTCMESHTFKSASALEKLIKNFTLLSLVESRKNESN